MIRVFTRQIERLHSEEGQALVFVALMGLIIFLFLAMTMNVAHLVNTKIKNQNAADAEALSAAVWQARTLNLVAALNRNMIELWAVGLPLGQGCIVAGAGCGLFFCGDYTVDPLPCIACLALTFASCTAASAFFGGALTTGLFQDVILDAIDKNVIDPDVLDVAGLNFAFKPNTASLDVPGDLGAYVHYPVQGDDLLRAYTPGDPETGDYALERVGVCEILVMLARYANFWWHLSGETAGLTDDQWTNQVLPVVYDWYGAPNGQCYHNTMIVPGVEAMFPLALRSRTGDWNPQNVDSLLAITVAAYEAQGPPPALGKGSGPADCAWTEGDTRFACTNSRHYAIASAHAYSESASRFYNTDMAGLSTGYLVPFVPFEMDWEARLFPVEPYPGGGESPHGGWVAYQDIANQAANDGFAADYDFLLNNVLMLNGMHFFLY